MSDKLQRGAFRVWNSKKKQYEWAADFFISQDGELFERFDGGRVQKVSADSLENYTVEHFTGFYDCDGKPIFEGDKLQRGSILYGVVFEDGKGWFLIESGLPYLINAELYLLEDCKIVGTIHENPTS